jgi:hypothetical protein
MCHCFNVDHSWSSTESLTGNKAVLVDGEYYLMLSNDIGIPITATDCFTILVLKHLF